MFHHELNCLSLLSVGLVLARGTFHALFRNGDRRLDMVEMKLDHLLQHHLLLRHRLIDSDFLTLWTTLHTSLLTLGIV